MRAGSAQGRSEPSQPTDGENSKVRWALRLKIRFNNGIGEMRVGKCVPAM